MKKLALWLALAIFALLGLGGFVGCEKPKKNGLEGRYVFASYTEYERKMEITDNSISVQKGEILNQYKVGSNGYIKESNKEHAFSRNSYILDIYNDGRYYLSGEVFSRLGMDWQYDYYWKGGKGNLFLGDEERDIMFFKFRDGTRENSTEQEVYRGIREKNAIILYAPNSGLMNITEIRLEKLDLNAEQAQENAIVGKYVFSYMDVLSENKTERFEAGAVNPDGVKFNENFFVVVLFSDGRAIARMENIGAQVLQLGESGKWQLDKGEVVLKNFTVLPSALGQKGEVRFSWASNALTTFMQGDIAGQSGSINIVLTKKKIVPIL